MIDARMTPRPLRRSTLLVPSHREELLHKASLLEPDVLLLDLQDSVPLNDAAKAAARENCVETIRLRRHRALEVSVRINGPREPWVLADVRMAVMAGAGSLTLPQARGLRDVLFVEGLIEVLSREVGVPGPGILLEVETPAVLCELEVIASHSRRVNGLCVAPYDYALETEAQVTIFGREGSASGDVHLSWLRPKAVAVARAHGWTASDAVAVADPRDAVQVLDAVMASRRLGFDGSAVMHPSHLGMVNKCFCPSDEELSWALEAVAGATAMRQQLKLASHLLAVHEQIRKSEARRRAAVATPST